MALKPRSSSDSNSRAVSRGDWIRLILAFLAVLVTAIWLLRGRGALGVPLQWTITPNLQPWPIGAWGLPLAVLIIFGGAAALSIYDRFGRAKSRREQKTSVLTALICLGILGFLWPWSLLGPGQLNGRPGTPTLEGRFNIIAAMWSDVANGYFGTAYQIDEAQKFTREYSQKWQRVDSPVQAHVATHPPGAVLWFYGARRLYEGVPIISNTFETLTPILTSQSRAELVPTAQLARETASRLVQAPPPPPLPASAVGNALFCAALLGLSLVFALPAVYGLASLEDVYKRVDETEKSFVDETRNNTNETGKPFVDAQNIDETAKLFVDETQTRLDEREQRGLLAAFLWVLAPTLNLFAFTLDALVAAGITWTLFLAARGLVGSNRNQIFYSIAAGVTLAFTSFLSLGALAAGAILVAAAIALRRRDAAKFLGFGALAFGSIWLLLSVWGGFNPLEITRNALAAHYLATLQTRTHAPWILMNVLMWMMFAGWPLVVLLAKKPASNRENFGFSIVWAFGGAAILTILLLTLGGNVRGEVERLWLFTLAPLGALAANQVSWRVAIPLVVLQGAQTLMMSATLAPLVRPF